MTHEEFVDEITRLVAEMEYEYLSSSGYALEFKAEAKLTHNRKLIILVEKEDK